MPGASDGTTLRGHSARPMAGRKPRGAPEETSRQAVMSEKPSGGETGPSTGAEYLIRHTTLRQLQLMEAIVRLGSFTRAAEELFLTQPTVSMQI